MAKETKEESGRMEGDEKTWYGELRRGEEENGRRREGIVWRSKQEE